MEWLWSSAQDVSATYGVDPRIYLALVLVTIPPFYLAFGVVVRDLMRAYRESGGAVSLRDVFRIRSFTIAVTAMVALWLVPYVYVLLWGHNLPAWLLLALVVMMVTGGASLYRRVQRRASRPSEDGKRT